jgi:hypothetical protein
VKLETAFQRAFGRAPTRAEVEQIERICDAFGVQDNDALKHIAALFGFYHAHLRLYPEQCVTGVRQWLASPEGGVAMISAAIRSTPTVSERPSPPPPPAPVDVAAVDRRQLVWVTLAGFGVTSLMLFGSVCMALGARLAGGSPCWVPRNAQQSVAANLVLAPFGWLALLAVFVPGIYAGAWGWRRGRDSGRPSRERVTGWAAFAAITAAFAGWIAFLGALPQ